MPSKADSPFHKTLSSFCVIVQNTGLELYTHIGSWFLIGLLSFFFAQTLLLLPCILVALFRLTNATILKNSQNPSLQLFFKKIFSKEWKDILLCTVCFLPIVLCISLFIFYRSMPFSWNKIKFLGSIVCFWSIIFWIILFPTILCAIIHFRSMSFKQILLFSVYSLICQPLLTVFVCLFFLMVSVLLYLSLLGFVFFWFPFTAILFSHLFQTVIKTLPSANREKELFIEKNSRSTQ